MRDLNKAKEAHMTAAEDCWSLPKRVALMFLAAKWPRRLTQWASITQTPASEDITPLFSSDSLRRNCTVVAWAERRNAMLSASSRQIRLCGSILHGILKLLSTLHLMRRENYNAVNLLTIRLYS
jgi:hypothetical protein